MTRPNSGLSKGRSMLYSMIDSWAQILHSDSSIRRLLDIDYALIWVIILCPE